MPKGGVKSPGKSKGKSKNSADSGDASSKDAVAKRLADARARRKLSVFAKSGDGVPSTPASSSTSSSAATTPSVPPMARSVKKVLRPSASTLASSPSATAGPASSNPHHPGRMRQSSVISQGSNLLPADSSTSTSNNNISKNNSNNNNNSNTSSAADAAKRRHSRGQGSIGGKRLSVFAGGGGGGRLGAGRTGSIAEAPGATKKRGSVSKGRGSVIGRRRQSRTLKQSGSNSKLPGIGRVGGTQRKMSILGARRASRMGGATPTSRSARQPSVVAYEQNLQLDGSHKRVLLKQKFVKQKEQTKATPLCPSGKPCSVMDCTQPRMVDGNGYCKTHYDSHVHGETFRHKRSHSVLQRILGHSQKAATPSKMSGIGMGGGMRRGMMGGAGMHTKKKDSLLSHVAGGVTLGSSGVGGGDGIVEEEEGEGDDDDPDTDEELARHVPLSAAYDTDSDDDDSYLHRLGVAAAPRKPTSSLHPNLSAHHEKAKFSSKIRTAAGVADDVHDDHIIDVRAHLKDHNRAKKAPISSGSHAHADQYTTYTFMLPKTAEAFATWAATTSATATGGVQCMMAALHAVRHKRYTPAGVQTLTHASSSNDDAAAVANCLHESVLRNYHGSAGSSTGSTGNVGGHGDNELLTRGDSEALTAMSKKHDDVTAAYMHGVSNAADTFTCDMFTRHHADAELNGTMTVMIKDAHSKYPRSVKLRRNNITGRWKLVHWRNLLR